ncbi:MAG: hypothetical protein JST16_04405 [Bdellovibrionales bacterium]|nr:hypothetical protein [Bdellovibrionales bacterium]
MKKFTTPLIFLISFLVSFLWMNHSSLIAWDDWEHILQSRWLVSTYGLTSPPTNDPSLVMKWYAPLWETIMGLGSWVFLGFLQDTIGVRHALTFALYPTMLWLAYRWLRQCGESRETSVLSLVLVASIIRLGGHAAFNTKDFPFAAGFFLATLGTWILLQRALRPSTPRLRDFALLGSVSILPYLLRSPVVLHFGLVGLTCAWQLYRRSQLSWARRAALIATLPLAALATVMALYPAIRIFGLTNWLESFQLFSRFPWIGPVTIWGTTYRSDLLPWWYAFSWLPVICTPLAFLLLIAGLAQMGIQKNLRPALTLRSWIALVTLGAWASVLIKQPVLYDEERHLLFLYPTLFLLAGLGFARWNSRTKLGLSCLLAVGVLWSHVEWGRYAYVYKSALVGDRNADRFMGDYWGACVAQVMESLPGKVDPRSDIVIIGPSGIGPVLLERMNSSRVVGRSGFEGFHIKDLDQAHNPAVLIGINRAGMLGPVQSAIVAGKAKEIARVIMPPDNIACLAAYFP